MSAKYGLLDPEEEIDPYELALFRQPKPRRVQWAKHIASRIHDLSDQEDEIIFLAGKPYTKEILPFMRRKCDAPFQLPIGKRYAAMKSAIDQKKRECMK